MSNTPMRVIKSVTVTDSILTATSVTEADHAAWNSGTTYAAGDRVILTSTHKIYESLQAANLNKSPTTEANWWVEVSPTNRWKCLDLSNTTQTLIDTADYYEFTPGQAVNSVALINISGVLTIRIRLTDPYYGVVYDKTANVTTAISESSWYAWFFEPRTETQQFVASDLPSYPNAVLRVDITSSSTALIGAMVFGTERSIGIGVQKGVRMSIQDYSRKERNQWGDTVLVQRAYAKRISYPMFIANAELDNTFTLLADLRATPCLWIGSDAYGSLSVFGFYNTFDINISYANYSDCTLDIEGLT